MGQKAYKLKIPLLRKLCDFFAVDRSDAKDKDSLVDALLDFLGAPSEKHLKGSKATPNRKASRKSKKEPEEEDAEEEDEEEEEEEKENVEDEDEEMEDVVDVSKAKEKVVKGSAKKPTPKAKGKTNMPTDDQLREWVNAYVICHNMSKSTIKQAIEIANEKFDVDITPMKPKIKEFLRDAL
jgi:hypothetical protein